LKNSRFQKLSTTFMPTMDRFSAMIAISRIQADHFSSERK
jgi:hypothetical protein